MTTRLLPIGIAFLALACGGSTETSRPTAPVPTTTTVAPRAADQPVPGTAEIQAVVDEVYSIISGPAGQERNWARMRTLFTPEARLSAIMRQPPPDATGAGPRPAIFIMSVDEWIERSGPFIVREGFFETEIHNEIERYGNLAHVWSTYEARTGSPDSAPIDRGINSIQLVYGEGKWWVYSILWHSERAGAGTIPAAYLP